LGKTLSFDTKNIAVRQYFSKEQVKKQYIIKTPSSKYSLIIYCILFDEISSHAWQASHSFCSLQHCQLIPPQ